MSSGALNNIYSIENEDELILYGFKMNNVGFSNGPDLGVLELMFSYSFQHFAVAIHFEALFSPNGNRLRSTRHTGLIHIS